MVYGRGGYHLPPPHLPGTPHPPSLLGMPDYRLLPGYAGYGGQPGLRVPGGVATGCPRVATGCPTGYAGTARTGHYIYGFSNSGGPERGSEKLVIPGVCGK